MTGVLLANGLINDYAAAGLAAQSGTYIIACDGGLVHAQRLGLKPDCILGDMDSVPPELLADYVENGLVPRRYPRDKDETDLSLAMSHLLAQNPSEIVVLGAMGGRFDHAMANIHVLAAPLEMNIPAVMLDENTVVRLMRHRCKFRRELYKTVTLLPFTERVTGITTQGLRFPLRGETLQLGSTRGVSNCFTAEEAEITTEEGILLVILNKEE